MVKANGKIVSSYDTNLQLVSIWLLNNQNRNHYLGVATSRTVTEKWLKNTHMFTQFCYNIQH